jgi:hypothetical protein
MVNLENEFMKQTRKIINIRMLGKSRKGVTQIVNAFVVGLAFTSGIAQAVTTYTMKDIGISPTAISSTGQVLGSNYMLYDNGILTSIRTMTAPALLTQGFDINALGQVVGYGTSTGSAFIRNPDGTYVNVGPSPDPNFRPGAALAINDSGQVAGQFTTLNTSLYPCAVHSFLGSATNPEIYDLGTLGGSRTNVADINGNGEVVGQSSILRLGSLCPLIPNYHAFVYSTAVGIQDLHSPAMLGDDSIAFKINNFRFVAGNFANGLTVPDLSGFYPNGYPIRHAVIWNLSAGTYRDLGNGTKDSSLMAINDSGIAVGFERTITNYPCNGCGPTTTSQNAVLVDTNGTSMLDLNSLVQGLPTGWSLLKAVDINKDGKIIALARDASGVSHGVMLTPSNITTPLPPAAPNGLSSNVISESQINLKWIDVASNETNQILERCQGNGCTNFSSIATLAAGVTSFSDTGLAASTQYSYRIKAHGTTGDSGYSNTVSATTLPPAITPIPAAPSNLNATATSRSRIVLSWADNSSNEQSFVIERCKGVGCSTFAVVATVAANAVSFNNSSLTRSTSYSYRIRAINATGSSGYSNIDTAKTFD